MALTLRNGLNMELLSLGCSRTVPRDLLSTLERESQMLESMENRFANLRMRRAQSERDSLKIACYYKELYIPGLGKVVSYS